jgi:hypothetical protein
LNLPFQSRIIENTRDHLIFDTPMPHAASRANRVAIVWDKDRDERIIAAYTSLAYRDFQLRAHLLALAESGGIVTAWFAPFTPDVNRQRKYVQTAVDNALLPGDRWKVAPLQMLAMRDGRVDVGVLPADSPVYWAASVYGLGEVTA